MTEKASGSRPDMDGGGGDTSPIALGFEPSNVVLGAVSTAQAGDLTLAGQCVVNAEPGVISCDSGNVTARFAYATTEQTDPDRGKVAIFYMRNLRIEAGASVRVMGPVPVVLVAAGAIRVNGLLTAPLPDLLNLGMAVAGGFSARREL